MLLYGTASTLAVGLTLMTYDNKNVIQKMCNHLSENDVEIFQVTYLPPRK